MVNNQTYFFLFFSEKSSLKRNFDKHEYLFVFCFVLWVLVFFFKETDSSGKNIFTHFWLHKSELWWKQRTSAYMIWVIKLSRNADFPLVTLCKRRLKWFMLSEVIKKNRSCLFYLYVNIYFNLSVMFIWVTKLVILPHISVIWFW